MYLNSRAVREIQKKYYWHWLTRLMVADHYIIYNNLGNTNSSKSSKRRGSSSV